MCSHSEFADLPHSLRAIEWQPWFCARGARRAPWPLQRYGELRGAGDPVHYGRDARRFRDSPIRGVWPLPGGAVPRVRDVPPPCCDALPLVWTYFLSCRYCQKTPTGYETNSAMLRAYDKAADFLQVFFVDSQNHPKDKT